ncbi:MFS transporter [Streptomyces sp. NPDC047046]|uniref:MFS transporter n=1 Tax=Streptomyces sp. NPDC047046 TaxID=3155378 RepID=UPI0033F8CEAD
MTTVASATYGSVLRTPYVVRTFLPALLGRLSYGMVPLALLLCAQRAAGSYALAGLATSLFGGASVLLSPVRGGLVDRYGARRALVPLALAYAAPLVALAALPWRGRAPLVALFVLTLLAGALTPPIGPTMRMLWGRLLPGKGALRRAYALDTVCEELLFLSGGALVGLALVVTGPAAALVGAAVLIAVGVVGMAASPVAARPAGIATPRATGGGMLRASGLLPFVAVLAALGVCLGALDLLVLAHADAHGAARAVPWIMAALSAGSAMGGLAFGRVAPSAAARAQLAVCAVALACLIAACGAAPGPFTLTLGVAAAGVFLAPAMTTAYLAAEDQAPPGASTRAGTWLNTGFNAGSTVGATLAGLAADHLPLGLCFVLAGAPVLVAAACTVRPEPRPSHV